MDKLETAARIADIQENGRGISLRDAIAELAGVSDVSIVAYTEYNGRRVPCGFGDGWVDRLNNFLEAAKGEDTYTIADTLEE